MTGRPNRDPNGEWKAIVLSYDYIFSLSEKKCSYCLNEQQAMALVQIAEYLSWQTRWDDAVLGKDRDKLAAFSAGIQDILMSGCCGDEQQYITRIADDGTVEISYDGGVNWVDDPSPDPRLDGLLYPRQPIIEGEDMKCIGAANIVDWFHDQEQRTIDTLDAGGSISAIISALISLIVLFVGVTATGGLATPLLIGLASALAFTGSTAFSAAMTGDVYDRLKCNLFCHISDDLSFTEDAWQEIKQELIDTEGGIAFRFLFDNINTLGTIGLANIARSGSVAAADCTSCDCVPTCEDPNKFVIGLVTSQTENPDGSTTFTVDAALKLDGTYAIEWGAPSSVECCCITDLEVTSGLCTGEATYWALCGEGTVHNGTTFPPDELAYFAYQQNGCLTAPFTIEITFGGCE